VIRFIPSALVALRFLLGPLLLLDALDGRTSGWFVVGLVAAFLSDVLDGVIARRLGLVTARLRKADSLADYCLYGCILAGAWASHRDAILASRVPLIVMLLAQALSWSVDWMKFRALSSYHAYTAKAWGVALFGATVALFACDDAGAPLWLAAGLGVICNAEAIAMTLVLPRLTHDVPSLAHALRLRRERDP